MPGQERWRSGRSRWLAKPLSRFSRLRGFESPSLRIDQNRQGPHELVRPFSYALAVRFLLPCLLIALAGCVERRMIVKSDPPGAVVRLDGDRVATAPATFKIRWSPFRRYKLLVKLPGYRPVSVRLRDDIRLWRYPLRILFRPIRTLKGTPHTHLRIVMVPEHGRSGTWTPADVPQ